MPTAAASYLLGSTTTWSPTDTWKTLLPTSTTTALIS